MFTLLGILGILMFLLGNWCATVGFVFLICLCFNLQFSIAVATGIWLIRILISSIFESFKRGKV